MAEPNDVVDFLRNLRNAEGVVCPGNAVVDSSLEEFHVLANHLSEVVEVPPCSSLLLLPALRAPRQGRAYGERRRRRT